MMVHIVRVHLLYLRSGFMLALWVERLVGNTL